LQWIVEDQGDLRRSLGPKDVAHFFYALFHSPTYRQRYADWLRADFPRVFVPADRRLLRELCNIGSKLAALHLFNEPVSAGRRKKTSNCSGVAGEAIGPGYPKHVRGKVYVSKTAFFDGVPSDAWEYRVGGHQVLRKWLKDRRHRTLTDADAAHYRQMAAALAETRKRMDEIDRLIERHGVWPAAFVPR
jgi:predicted helicase